MIRGSFRNWPLALLLLSVLALFLGCSTTLGVSRFDPQPSPINGKEKEPSANGIYYALPAAEYELILERKLNACDCLDKKTGEKCVASGGCEWTVKIGVDAEIKAKYKPDRYATYFVDYRWMDRAMKQTDLRIDLYENGTLKSLNAGIIDFTAEVLEKTIGSAINLVASAVGLPSLPGMKANGTSISCKAGEEILNGKVRDALRESESLKDRIKTLKRSIPTSEHAIKVMASRQDVDITKLTKLQNMLEKKQLELVEQEKKLEMYQARLKHKTSLIFTPRLAFIKPKGNKCFTIEDTKLRAFESGQGAISKWFDADEIEKFESKDKIKEEIDKKAGVGMKFFGIPRGQREPIHQQKPCCFGDPSKEPDPGLVYRQPLLAKWALCRGRQVNDATTGASEAIPCGDDKGAINFKTGEDLVPQLGIIMSLPLESDAFEDQTLEAAFRPDGSLEYAQFSDQAGAVKASNAFASSAGSLAQFITARQQADQTKAADEAARLDAETKRLQAELALKKARQELNEYNQSLSGD